jgi:GNAT superfamily N-acetyltransferase
MSGALIFSGVIRPLTQEDAGHFFAHLSRLDEQSRHDRFHGAISNLALADYAAKALGEKGLVLGFFIDTVLRGAVEIRFIGQVGEFAATVEHDFQHGGIGTALMGRSFDMARKAGIKSIHLNFVPSNHAMQQLASHYGADFHFSKDDVEADFSIAA